MRSGRSGDGSFEGRATLGPLTVTVVPSGRLGLTRLPFGQ
jgi:hypothetical protein